MPASRGSVRDRSPSHRAAIRAVTTGVRPNTTEMSPEGMNWAAQ